MVLSSLGKQSYFYIQTIWLLSCYKNAIKYQDLQFNISDFNKKNVPLNPPFSVLVCGI